MQQVNGDSSAVDSDMQKDYLKKLHNKMINAESTPRFTTNEKKILKRFIQYNEELEI